MPFATAGMDDDGKMEGGGPEIETKAPPTKKWPTRRDNILTCPRLEGA